MIRRFADPSSMMLWFDLDDTLWDMSGNSVVCLRELYESQRLDRVFASPEEWNRIYHEINRTLWDQYGRGEISRDYLRSERFARPLRLVGVADDEAAGMSKDFDRLYLDSLGRKTKLVDGAREILEYLRLRGYRAGIVSNGFREVQYNKLKSSAIDGYFDIVVLSDDAGYNKPDPRFFSYALDKAGSRELRNIVIGDSLTADIAGAVRAGLEAIWLRRDPSETTDLNVMTIDSLRELEKIF